MDRTDCAIVIHTQPKAFQILDGMFGLLRRQAAACHWPVYLATEQSHNFEVQRLCAKQNIKIIALEDKDGDFLESRVASMKALPAEIQQVLPLQEDFLMERPGIDTAALKHALEILDVDQQVTSLRLMPCPGSSAREGFWGNWLKLLPQDLQFSYQATIWRREVYTFFLERLIQQSFLLFPDLKPRTKEQNEYCIRINPAETHPGDSLMRQLYPTKNHLCWPRKGSWANAVYWCPWPYRPTAIVKGVLQPWARDLIRREGFSLGQGAPDA